MDRKPNNPVMGVTTVIDRLDKVEVFCRIKPYEVDTENCPACIEKISDNVLQCRPPMTFTSRGGINKICNFTFSGIFDQQAGQTAVFSRVGLPLIEDLLKGKNGIIFTYGITGSGKTYTMAGTGDNPGVLPRALDVVFNSIQNNQVKENLVVPDKLNGFELLSESESISKQNKNNDLWRQSVFKRNEYSGRMRDESCVPLDNQPKRYCVFVTFTEIYNNFAYDLLEDLTEKAIKKNPQVKMLREDATRNMYVFGATELEVRSADEGFILFNKGQRRRKIAFTSLNAESSRSHSIFTIRVVHVPLTDSGELASNIDNAVVSKLCLVDLAGSERQVRAGTKGHNLREAGNINSSLMTLRKCIEILRDNQLNGTSKMVPYRDSRLTMHFKSYFEFGGCIKMVVCIDPRPDNFDETMQVMKFSEMTQEVQVMIPPTPVIRNPVSLVAKRKLIGRPGVIGKSRIHNKKLEPPGRVSLIVPKVPQDLVELLQAHNDDDKVVTDVIALFEKRKTCRLRICQRLKQLANELRTSLVKELENAALNKQYLKDKSNEVDYKSKILWKLEEELVLEKVRNDELEQRVEYFERNAKALEQAVEEKDLILTQNRILEQKERHLLELTYQRQALKNRKKFEAQVRKHIEAQERQSKEELQKWNKVKELVLEDTNPSLTKSDFLQQSMASS